MGVVNATNSPNALDDNPGRIDGNQSTFNSTGATTTTPIDGVPCTRALETTAEHFHDHFSLYVNGQQYAVPAAIGIYHPKLIVGSNSRAGFWNIDPNDPASCHYLVHVHAGDGVVHMESPTAGVVFHLKDFLDIWGVTKTTTGFLAFSGPTRWFMTNEYAWNPGHYRVQDITNVDPATIVLTPHVEFTVEIGSPLVNILNYNFIDQQL